MANAMQFELASPQKRAANKPVVMVTVPGADGYFGVLLGHAPMAAQLGAGVLDIYENDMASVTERYFVAGGFCEVTTERCSVMAEEIVALKDLNREAIEAELKELMAADQNDDATAGKLATAHAKLLAVG